MLRAAIQRARERLSAAGIPAAEAALDAELLARHALGWDRARLVARLQDEPPPGFAAAYQAFTDRRARREPVAYIIGSQEFWGRDFRVGRGVLIPRPETEILVEEALAFARTQDRHDLRIVDIGTGSGCLAVTLALELPDARVHATDISPEALSFARDNALRLRASVSLHHGPILADVAPDVDLIVANPPYVTGADHARLAPEVRDYEPVAALAGGADGLDVVRLVVGVASAALRPGGRLLMEIGHGQAAAARQIVANAEPLVLLRIRDDLQGIPRAVVAERRDRRR